MCGSSTHRMKPKLRTLFAADTVGEGSTTALEVRISTVSARSWRERWKNRAQRVWGGRGMGCGRWEGGTGCWKKRIDYTLVIDSQVYSFSTRWRTEKGRRALTITCAREIHSAQKSRTKKKPITHTHTHTYIYIYTNTHTHTHARNIFGLTMYLHATTRGFIF